jgi:GAF domain-containing protein
MRKVAVSMTRMATTPRARRKPRAGGSERDLLTRFMTERQKSDGQRRAGDPTALGRSATNTHWRNHLLERLERGDSLEQIDRDLRRIGGLSEEERAALWLLARGEQQRRAPGASGLSTHMFPVGRDFINSECRSAHSAEVVVSTLELARAEISMDVAILGEINDGREVVRLVAGQAESFGLAVGASAPVEETFCQRLLEGRLSYVVRDAISDERVRDLEVARVAGIGAYIGVPLTTLDARLYILCCLAHERRPALGKRDVL